MDEDKGLHVVGSLAGYFERFDDGLTRGEHELLVRSAFNTHVQDSLMEFDFERARNNINVQHPENGDTPLHKAVMALHFKNVEILLKRGADKERKNKKGQPPLQALFTIIKSKENKQPMLEMTRLLLGYGAKPVKFALRTTTKTQWHHDYCSEAIKLIDEARTQQEVQEKQQLGSGFK